jgi:glycosyltransferase involved in cell wall biosynthesis
MRILWVKMGGLWPLDTGGRQRTFQIVSALSRDHDVTVLTTHDPGEDPEPARRALPRCGRLISVPYRVPKAGTARFARALVRSWVSADPVDLWKWRIPAVRRHVAALLDARAIDVIVADFLFAQPNLPVRPDVPVVFFEHNVEYQIWRRLAAVERRWLRRAILAVEWRKVRRRERQALARATLTIAVSDADRDLLAAEAPGARLEVVPTGVDTGYFAPTGRAEVPHRLVFSGSMDWYPNEDAIRDFARTMWPALRQALPGVSLTVVGRRPGAGLRQALAGTGITLTGTVDDVRPYVDEAALYIVPLRIGGGTRLKIFEALAMGKAVVSTPLGAEGLGLVAGRHFVAAERGEPFVRAIVDLLGAPARRGALGEAGRRLVEEEYSWVRVSRIFERHLQHAVQRHEHIDVSTRRVAVSTR